MFLNIIAPSLASMDKEVALLQFERILESMLQLCTQCTFRVSHSSLIVFFCCSPSAGDRRNSNSARGPCEATHATAREVHST
jgi:hypothetical protein